MTLEPSDTESAFFKGWAKPGPVPPRIGEPLAHESLDALSGHFRIFQLREGHRFSTDDLLVAWYGTQGAPAVASVLDLGSGIGSVGMVAAWRLPGARFVTIEAQSESVLLARKSARYNGLESRYEIREGDFRGGKFSDPSRPPVLRPEEKFDLILGSPPYFPPESGILAGHPQKISCRFEIRGTIADYCETAASHLAPSGVFACIFPENPPHQGQRARDAFQASGLSVIRRRPVVLREGDSPLLMVYLAMRETDLPENHRGSGFLEPALVIRTREGRIHPEYSAIKLSIGFPP